MSRSSHGPAPGHRTLLLSAVAAVLGLLGGVAAYLLIKLIALLTNLALLHRVGWDLPNLAGFHPGLALVPIAIASGFVISCIARWSPEIRGHGIPEAMEAVLTKQSRIHPRTAVAKPLSAAIAIGAGGPFGAEGPIIVTGGALGSLLGQVLPVSPAERKILLACGAAAGMAATFGTPLAAVVLVIELLLFEFSVRAFIPLVVASALAGGVHSAIFGTGPLFTVPAHDYHGLSKLPWFAILGVVAGLLAVVITKGLFFVEAGYRRLPVRQFWHPVIGAFGFAVIGLIQPRALGVGYDAISDILLGRIAVGALIALAIAKLLAWWIALASGTSGGTLAPLLLISGAFGSACGVALEHIAPGTNISPGAFALVAMAATFGASIGATFASIVFLFELTRDYQVILPLMLASVIAEAVAGGLLHDNLMTEKLTRRGVRVQSDFAVDVLGTVTVAEVMSTTVHSLPDDTTIGDARRRIARDGHGAYPLLDPTGRLVGIIAREDVLALGPECDREPAMDHASTDVVSVAPGTTLIDALQLLLDEGIGHLPVVDHDRVVGMCTRTDILRARQRRFADERLEPGWRKFRVALSPTRGPRPVATNERDGARRYLIVANQTLGGPVLADAIIERLDRGVSRFFVLVPATPPRDLYTNMIRALEGELPDERQARVDAGARLTTLLEWIRDHGGEADGQIGDPDPLVAIRDVLAKRSFDEIIVSTLPAHVSKWLRHDLPTRIESTFDVPVAHVSASPSVRAS